MEPPKRPVLISLFSAPQYAGKHENKAAVFKYGRINGKLSVNVQQFDAANAPVVIPDFKNIFEICIPKILKCAADILTSIEEIHIDEQDGPIDTIWQTVVSKIRIIGKFALYLNTVANESENINSLKELMGVDKLPAGYLSNGPQGIRRGTCKYFN
jgi:serine/threonine-protein phosphatase 2B catalytic subunit